MTVLGQAVLLVVELKKRRHCVSEGSDTVAQKRFSGEIRRKSGFMGRGGERGEELPIPSFTAISAPPREPSPYFEMA